MSKRTPGRTNVHRNKRSKGRSVAGGLSLALSGLLAGAAVLGAITPAALQDVGALAGVAGKTGERWAMRLVSVPVGTAVHKSTNRLVSVEKEAVAARTDHLLAIRDPHRTVVLELNDGVAPKKTSTTKAWKGNRVADIDRSRFDAAEARPRLMASNSIVAPNASALMETEPAVAKLLAQTQRFHRIQRESDVGATAVAQLDAGDLRMRLPIGQLREARIAARQMARLQRQEAIAAAKPATASKPATVQLASVDQPVSNETTGSIVTAYAPQEDAGASPFDAVLRPTLPKAKPESDRVEIVLHKDDHEWALNKLPKNSTSAAQRRCLAIGVYFEARGEPVKGQRAVAQVILNRVKNPTYPNSICGVVYQNKHMRNRCQFSFTCDGIKDRIKSKKHWEVAKTVANDAIDGRAWLKVVGSSSHYHADYVRPRWRKSMKRLVKIGRHIFYRTYGGGWS